jgi:hypothetical protein
MGGVSTMVLRGFAVAGGSWWLLSFGNRVTCAIPNPSLLGESAMSNIIDFLEAVGQNANLRYASPEKMQHLLADSQVDDELQGAVLAGDQQRLSELLRAKNTCCMLMSGRVSCLLMSGMNDEDEILGERRA